MNDSPKDKPQFLKWTKDISLSPVRLMVVMAVTIFITELFVMILLYVLQLSSPVHKMFIDSFFLLILVSPALYYFLFLPLVRQIDERKRAEEVLLQEKQKTANISNYANCGLLLLDGQTRVSHANKLAEEWFGPLDQIQGKFCWEIFKMKNPQKDCAGLKVLRTGKEVRSDTFAEILHGETKYFYVVASPVRNSLGQIHQISEVVIDISKRKQAEEALKTKQQEIEKLNANLERNIREEVEKNRRKDFIMMHQSRLAAMGEMLGNIAHQWKQPLNALNLLLYNIKDLFDEDQLTKENLDDLFNRGTMMVEKMSATVDDFKNFFKPNKKKKDFCINKIIKNSLELIDSSIRFNNISITVNEKEKITVAGYPNEYSQVILNIINNAKDAILEKGIRGEITIDISQDNGSAIVKITDNGGGIDQNVQTKIFNPYFTTKSGEKGTGIGLYISKAIIEKHMSGYLEVHSNNGGTEFRIITPVAQSQLKTMGPSI